MTAQVVLMNSLGVAIASDSVISSRTDDNTVRTLATSEKIIQLFGDHDIAFMACGNAELAGFPIEVLVWEWSRTLTGKKENVPAYFNSFLDWLGNCADLRKPEIEENTFIHIVDEFYKKIWNATEDFVIDENSEPNVVRDEACAARIKLWTDWASGMKPLEGLTNSWSETLWRKYQDKVFERFDFWFDDRPVGTESEQALKAATMNLADWKLPSGSIELVLVGFGSADLLPTQVNAHLYGVLDGRVRRSNIKVHTASRVGSWWQLFGQSDATQQFMQGLHPVMSDIALSFTEKSISSALENFCKEHDVEFTSEISDKIKATAKEARDRLDQTFTEEAQVRFVNPLEQVIRLSPEADLAKIALSLVEIESIRQAIDHSTPTVGGPIDVAVVSKMHGFRWVQHKSINT